LLHVTAEFADVGYFDIFWPYRKAVTDQPIPGSFRGAPRIQRQHVVASSWNQMTFAETLSFGQQAVESGVVALAALVAVVPLEVSSFRNFRIGMK